MTTLLYGVCFLLWVAGGLRAEVFTFDSDEKWRTWQIPQGLVEINEAGQLELVKFRKDIDPVRNAGAFFHDTREREQAQGAHVVGARGQIFQVPIDGAG